MRIKLIAAGAAIALAASVGSASAADQFTTLDGVTAQGMTPQELGVVVGGHNAPGVMIVQNRGMGGSKASSKAKPHNFVIGAGATGGVQTGHTCPTGCSVGVVTFNF